MTLTRRQFMQTGASASALTLATAAIATDQSPLPGRGRQQRSGFPFQHGVASGDPLHDRVILWTRVTPPTDLFSVHYRWRIAHDPQFEQLVAQGSGVTDSRNDFTIKLDATGLQPGQSYYYVFESLGQMSDIGRTKTLPLGNIDHLRIAFTSCSNYARGYFNVYKEIARRADLDVVLHLGDYIYEYDNLEQSLVTGRIHEPPRETVTLDDYRKRHACYKADKDLQEVHRQHPFIVIWDDHEVANNAWQNQQASRDPEYQGGADNHQQHEGSWRERLSGAVRAYLEWMPIREGHNSQGLLTIYRRFRFGNLLDLSMLDTRLAGRDAQTQEPEIRDAQQRTLLGYEQERWLEQGLASAQAEGVCWKLLGQQVMMSQFSINQSPLNHDQWDGYPAARQRLFDVLRQQQVDNFVVLTGDIHSSWALELNEDPFAAQPMESLGVELVTPAVTSPGIESETRAALAAASLESLLPHLNFVDFYYRGYVLLDITAERIQAEWWVVDNVERPRYASDCLRALTIPSGSARLHPAEGISPAKAAVPLAPAFSQSFAYFRHWRQHQPDYAMTGLLADRG